MVTSFLLKKRTNPTPYSLILYFKKKKNPPCKHAHSSLFILTWNCQKPLIILPYSNTLDVILKNWDYCTWLCRYGSQWQTYVKNTHSKNDDDQNNDNNDKVRDTSNNNKICNIFPLCITENILKFYFKNVNKYMKNSSF